MTNLHPRAQVALAQVLAKAAMRGVRVVMETHSSMLLLGVQTLVAKDSLSADKVKLHWFQREKDGHTVVRSGELDEASLKLAQGSIEPSLRPLIAERNDLTLSINVVEKVLPSKVSIN